MLGVLWRVKIGTIFVGSGYNSLMITGAFILVVIELKLIKSDVLPFLSAAILPIIV